MQDAESFPTDGTREQSHLCVSGKHIVPMETLKKATYVTAISVSLILCVTFVLMMIPNLATTWEPHQERIDPDEAIAAIRDDAAYRALYERYPDAVERVNQDRYQVELEAGVMNTDTGNQLVLRMYAFPGDRHITVHCFDMANDEEQYVDGLFAAEFVRTTDCISAP